MSGVSSSGQSGYRMNSASQVIPQSGVGTQLSLMSDVHVSNILWNDFQSIFKIEVNKLKLAQIKNWIVVTLQFFKQYGIVLDNNLKGQIAQFRNSTMNNSTNIGLLERLVNAVPQGLKNEYIVFIAKHKKGFDIPYKKPISDETFLKFLEYVTSTRVSRGSMLSMGTFHRNSSKSNVSKSELASAASSVISMGTQPQMSPQAPPPTAASVVGSIPPVAGSVVGSIPPVARSVAGSIPPQVQQGPYQPAQYLQQNPQYQQQYQQQYLYQQRPLTVGNLNRTYYNVGNTVRRQIRGIEINGRNNANPNMAIVRLLIETLVKLMKSKKSNNNNEFNIAKLNKQLYMRKYRNKVLESMGISTDDKVSKLSENLAKLTAKVNASMGQTSTAIPPQTPGGAPPETPP